MLINTKALLLINKDWCCVLLASPGSDVLL